MDVPCTYRNCREISTIIVEITRDPVPITRRVCTRHVEKAQAIAKQHDGIAYRLFPT